MENINKEYLKKILDETYGNTPVDPNKRQIKLGPLGKLAR